MFVKVFGVLLLLSSWVQSEDLLKIGALFNEEEADDLKVAFELSGKLYEFETLVKVVSQPGRILEIKDHVCSLANEGVIGIIDGIGGRASEHIQALTDMLELPHVTIQPIYLKESNWTYLSLFPSPTSYNNILKEIITAKDWNNFTILYEKTHILQSVEDLMQMGNYTDKITVSVRELDGENYRDSLTDAKKQGYYNFVVDCSSQKLLQFLTHAQQVGLMADEHSYIFLSPDLFTLDLSRYRYGGVNMTGFRLVHLQNSPILWEFTSLLNNETGQFLKPQELKTKVILVHDAVKIFNESVKKLGDGVKTESLNCMNYEAWSYGSTLLNFMKTNRVEGATRTLIFDGVGERNDVTLDILELTPSGNQTIGKWESNILVTDRPYIPVPESGGASIMRNKTFTVLIALTNPYAYTTESDQQLTGNERYEGFAIDLIEELSKMLGFNYIFEVEENYGKFDKDTQKWTGMVLKLREEKADFAICDLTITSERQRGIDFSTPFMTLGIGILYKEPSKQPPEMFSFMAVFSKEVWYYMVFVQFCIGLIMIFVGRISNKEWQNPVPCVEQPEELSNQFSFANSVWLIIGSVMQQGSEIAPIALAPRLITSIWWFFTMVMVASYVGTLVAFLTVEKNVLPFTTVDELANQKGIAFGCKTTGSTRDFFKDTKSKILKEMHARMTAKGWLVQNNDEGVDWAETKNYALFTESTAIEYYKERHCDLLQIGDLLDSKSYGIGMKKNSPYKRPIDDALLKLKETGELQKLKDIWWKEKRGGGKCGQKVEEDAKQLEIKNMIGAFVVLGAGCVIGIFVSIIDMLWGVFKRSVKYNTTFKYELIEELKFAIKFSGDVKPVKRPSSSAEGSDQALADAEGETKEEAKDELGSLRSARTIRSGRSTSTHRSAHSHCSRHSPSELSVAFARRRQYT